MFNQSDLTALIKDVTLRVPQIEPFFFVIPMTVMPKEDYIVKVNPMATAAVNNTRAVFCDEFMESLSPAKRRGLLIHEILHPALGHVSDPFVDNTLSRADFHQLANRAKDFVIENLINEMAEAANPGMPAERRPLSCNYPVDGKLLRFKGMSWRQVYSILREEPDQGGGGELDTHGQGEESLDAALEAVWRAAREESKQISESLAAGAGKGAGSIKIEDAPVAVSWQDTLSSYLTSIPAQVRKTWQRVDRRTFCATRQYAPTLTGTAQALSKVYLLVDTSGSMYEYLNTAAADIINLFKQIEVGTTSIVYYDVGIQEKLDLDHDDLEGYTIKSMPGGGGTNVKLALEELAGLQDFDDAAPIVVLTDGYDDYRLGNLQLGPLVWLSYGEKVISDKGVSIEVPRGNT